MHRFFAGAGEIVQGEVHFSADVSRQITRVLRLKPGKEVQVLDNLGNEFLVSLTVVSDVACIGEIIDHKTSSVEAHVRLTMLLSLTQREKFEWMLQKCTEIGAASFLPVITSRSLVQQPGEVLSKYPRWQKIIREAAEQSGRGLLPELLAPQSLQAALAFGKSGNELCLVAWEAEHRITLKEIIVEDIQRVAMLIGPEGGLTQEEIHLAAQQGYIPISLGRRILRMETAAIVAAALLMNKFDSD